MEPTTRLLTRPDVPAAGTDEYDRWKRDATIAYPGGYLKATYGDLIQTFTMSGTDACSATAVTVSRKKHTRVNTIGEPGREIEPVTFTYNKYPKRNGGQAEGGGVVTITTAVGSYTARMGGDIQTFHEWMCTNGISQLYDPIEFTSARGAHYGPYGSTPQSSDN